MTPQHQSQLNDLPMSASAAALNADCYCRTLDGDVLRRSLLDHTDSSEIMAGLLAQRPTLFSATTVFLAPDTYAQLVAGIASLERVIRSPGYQAASLQQAPPIAAHVFGPLGVFVSYDFHLAPDGPRLIEINSNAGGALLCATLAQAQRACCQAMSEVLSPTDAPADPKRIFISMFSEEWRRQRARGTPRNVTIVDDDPATQYLAPEFELFKTLLTRDFARAAIADSATLHWREGQLWFEDEPVDMVTGGFGS